VELREEEAMPMTKCQILVVDGDQRVRESVATSLMAAGYDVVAAEDGFHALSQLRRKLPDLVLSDLDMPGMSGFELASVVRPSFSPNIDRRNERRAPRRRGSLWRDRGPASSPKEANPRIC
jgi:CheY-like chemotaxis protein